MGQNGSRRFPVLEILGLIISIFACIGTWAVWPEIRQWIGLEPEISVSPTEHIPAPSPTNISVPATNEVAPSQISNVGIDVFDDFNKPEYDGSYNEGVWLNFASPPDEAVQENGVLALRLKNTNSDEIVLVSKHYNNEHISNPIAFEADLLLQYFAIPNVENSRGAVAITIDTDDSVDWYTECGVVGTSYVPEPYVGCFSGDYGTDYPNVHLDTWQNFRIEVDPRTMTITYFLNDQQIGTYAPPAAEKVKNANLTFMIKAWKNTSGNGEVVGFVDNVKIISQQ